jgi:hypothetical protein
MNEKKLGKKLRESLEEAANLQAENEVLKRWIAITVRERDDFRRRLIAKSAPPHRDIWIRQVDREGVGVYQFMIGADHVVAEWREQALGVFPENVFVESPSLVPWANTTPDQRRLGQVWDMVSWELVSALIAGPGDGVLRPYCEVYPQD